MTMNSDDHPEDASSLDREECRQRAVNDWWASTRPGITEGAFEDHRAWSMFWAQMAISAEPAAPAVDLDAVHRVFAQMMSNVSAYIVAADRSVSRNELDSAIPGKRSFIRQALDALVNGGYVQARMEGQFTRFVHVHDFPKETPSMSAENPIHPDPSQPDPAALPPEPPENSLARFDATVGLAFDDPGLCPHGFPWVVVPMDPTGRAVGLQHGPDCPPDANS